MKMSHKTILALSLFSYFVSTVFSDESYVASTQNAFTQNPLVEASYLHATGAAPSVVTAAPSENFPKIVVTGFFQADSAWFHQDQANLGTVGDIQDGADFRRARLAATGWVAENVAFNLEFDFSFPARPSFMDVWLEI